MEWRLEALLFRGSSCNRRAVYRIRVADFKHFITSEKIIAAALK